MLPWKNVTSQARIPVLYFSMSYVKYNSVAVDPVLFWIARTTEVGDVNPVAVVKNPIARSVEDPVIPSAQLMIPPPDVAVTAPVPDVP